MKTKQASLVTDVLLVLLMLVGVGCGDDAAPAAGSPAAPGAAPAAAAAAPVEAQACTANRHTCVMKPTGEVYCAGVNLDGELGDGTTQTRWSWVPVQGVSGARQLACGAHHTCVIAATGVFCWGNNASGALGAGNQNTTLAAVKVQGLADATQLALGDGFSCALRTGGSVSCWGDGEKGQLGNGATELSAAPVQVSALDGAVQVSAGRAHACARKSDGTVVCWGSARQGQLGQGTESPRNSMVPVVATGVAGATDVAAGGNHSCAITAAGVLCWGQNRYSQSGAGDENVMAPTAIAGLTGATQLALAGKHTCALVEGGAAKCWGYNNYTGQLLGVGSEEEKVITPTAVPGVTGLLHLTTSSSSSLGMATCGLNAAHQLWCWGTATDGRFGNDDGDSLHNAAAVLADVTALNAPASVPNTFAAAPGDLAPRTSFSVGARTVCGVREGRVYCFGGGDGGQLGTGSTRANPAASASPVVGISDAVQVANGLGRACALRRNGSVVCWGKLSSQISSSLPLPIDGLTDARSISVGGGSSALTVCAVLRAGGVSCAGQSMTGGSQASLSASAVEGLTDITEVNVGTSSACAMQRTGKVFCWGSGSYGQLANGDTRRSTTPLEVPRIHDAVALGGSSYNHCVVRENRSLSCWGSGQQGQLTNGKTGSDGNSFAPVSIRGLRGVAAVGSIGDTMCVPLTSGEGQCWGANVFGQTGHDDSDTRNVGAPWEYLRTDPAVAAFGNVAAMGCGRNFCCALHANGGVSCAGSTPLGGSRGFLGLSSRRSKTPIPATGITFSVITED
ncbi:MAG: hypothetical protein GXP55_20195 [Deltaproteobacteria bacterium]|nr:hypothetical protein [Deltaproteobacteria bacterium]